MSVLVCPSCERRFAVRSGGRGWRCPACSAELRTVERAGSNETKTGWVADGHLHYLRSLTHLPDAH